MSLQLLAISGIVPARNLWKVTAFSGSAGRKLLELHLLLL